MKCEYVAVCSGPEYTMPNKDEDKLVRHLMENLAEKYHAKSLKLRPEIREEVYIFTFQIPKKFNSKEYNEIWDSILYDARIYLKKLNKEYLLTKYSVNLSR